MNDMAIPCKKNFRFCCHFHWCIMRVEELNQTEMSQRRISKVALIESLGCKGMTTWNLDKYLC